MADIADDESLEDYDGLDYVVVPRPQELIELQKQSSSLKLPSKLPVDKSGSTTSNKSTDSKHSSRSKEKTSSKHEKKGSSKGKLPYKSPLNEGSPKKLVFREELSKRYESLKKKQYKFTSSDEYDLFFSKSKQSDLDTNKQNDNQFSKLMAEPAVTPMQRFRVLDARDLALRAKVVKPEDSKKVKITGTCPDMCPEKERYGRIAKNCLSVLEMKTTFDQNATPHDVHRYMIKEYSRSSADQQEPLPHELRPISVLNLTMDYLICNIMDKRDTITLEEWYDFIWNRTRSIRKDITQQELCDPQSVEIIEKCVRFHIHCAEALSEEDTATFDPKINNENLTKCLQTLKHMYHDLHAKGIQCRNEAEFRSYDILLSLTEGETLRLIKDIRKDLLKSPLIKSAFEAALAFKSQNYVKFFKIIEKANYLNSCILHRYIIEARIHALQIIVRAYSTQSNACMYPTVNLVKDLKFENETEAAEFCRCHGLEANEVFINIERKQFSKCASGLPVSRSSLLVASKRGECLGLIINNGILPSNPKHVYQPRDSFDENNMLKISNLRSIQKEVDEKLDQIDEQVEEEEVDEEMEIEDEYPLQVDSALCTDTVYEKNANDDFPIKDSGIRELEKRRTELLKQLRKMESATKLEQKKNQLSKEHVEKNKSINTSDLTTTSHKSVMFTSENSYSTEQTRTKETDCFKPSEKFNTVSENFFKQPASSFGLSDKLPVCTASSFFKFSNVSSTKSFPSISAPDSSEKVSPSSASMVIPNVSSVTTDVIRQPTSLNSGFSPFSSRVAMNFSFFDKSTAPTSHLSSIFSNKHDDGNHLKTWSNVHQSSSSSEIPLQERQEGNFVSLKPSSPDREEDHLGVEDIIPQNIENEMEIDKGITSEDLDEDSESSDEDIIEEASEVTAEKRKESEVAEFVAEVANEIVSKSIEECSTSICEEILNEERNLKAQLEYSIAAARNQLARKVILRWHIFTQRKRERRMYQNNAFFSPWQAMLLNTPFISSGAVNPVVAYRKHCSLSKSTAEMIKKRKEVTPGWENFIAEKIWPLNTFKPHSSYSQSSYFGEKGIKNFFKVCLVLPPDNNDPDMSVFIDWICAKFCLEKMQGSQFDYHKVFILSNGKTAVSVRAIQLNSDVSCNYAKFLDGVTAMLLFVPKTAKDLNLYLEDFSSLRDASNLDFPFPLYMYFMGSHEIPAGVTSYINEKIEDLSFTAINTQCMPKIDSFVENSEKILEGLKWFNEIEDKARPLPSLKKLSFRHYVEDTFAYVFNVLLCKVSFDDFSFLKQEPQHIINFYNKVIQFRASVLSGDFLERIHSSWPPEEIKHLLGEKFINMETQNVCKREMESLILPNFDGDPSSVSYAWEYARHIPSSCSNMVLSIKISDLHLDWIQKIIYCVEYLIQNSEFILTNGDSRIYFTDEDLLYFDCDQYWLDVLSDLQSNPTYTKRKNHFGSESSLKKQKLDSIEEIAFSDVDETRIPSPFTELDKENSFIIETSVSKNKLSSTVIDSKRKSLEFFLESPINLQSEKILAEPSEDYSFLIEVDVSNYKLSSTAMDNQRKPLEFSLENTSNSLTEKNSDWLDDTVKKPSGNTLSSIADKLSELRFNIQKTNILEDHFGQLLLKQL